MAIKTDRNLCLCHCAVLCSVKHAKPLFDSMMMRNRTKRTTQTIRFVWWVCLAERLLSIELCLSDAAMRVPFVTIIMHKVDDGHRSTLVDQFEPTQFRTWTLIWVWSRSFWHGKCSQNLGFNFFELLLTVCMPVSSVVDYEYDGSDFNYILAIPPAAECHFIVPIDEPLGAFIFLINSS